MLKTASAWNTAANAWKTAANAWKTASAWMGICDVVGSGKPEGETVLTLPDLAEPLERLAKRQKHEIKEPTHFRVKWVITDVGPVPFAMDCESQVVYCGKAQMTVHYGAGSIPSVMCLKGFHV